MPAALVILVSLVFLIMPSSGNETWAAEKFPIKHIECIVAQEAGADGDTINRPVMSNASQILGQPIMIVNKPGGGSALGYRELHRAKADGYTVGWGSSTLIANKLQGLSNIDYHDFTMLGAFATYFPVILAAKNTKRPFTTIQEVISFAKAHPGELSMATAWLGGAWWVAAMAFLRGTGLEVNAIPTAGSGAMSVAQVAGGHTDLCIVALGAARSMVEAGQVRILATLGEQRLWPPYEQVPTVKELGYDVSYESPNFSLGPPNMPKPVVEIWVKAIKQAVDNPEFKQYCLERGARWEYSPPEQVVAKLDKQREVMRTIMGKAGILKESK
jgi:tripartite-type tricarboxylate transporter receptor subunit TctC